MVGFILNIAPLLNYLRRRSPAPPVPARLRPGRGTGGNNESAARSAFTNHFRGFDSDSQIDNPDFCGDITSPLTAQTQTPEVGEKRPLEHIVFFFLP